MLFITQMLYEYGELQWNGTDGKTEEELVPVPLCPPQTPQRLTQAWTLASAVRGWRLADWAMAQPWRDIYASHSVYESYLKSISKCIFILIKMLTITYQCSVQRGVKHTSNNYDYADHHESYEAPVHHSPFRPYCDEITCIWHKHGCGYSSKYLLGIIHFTSVDVQATTNVMFSYRSMESPF
jgi:hypothetical protein